ncbi:MAG TPA: SCO family protein [Caldilineaceae bacterium]|nr:SCO family protein [Caldilineaceae bacterium]
MMKQRLIFLFFVLVVGLAGCSKPHEFSGTVFDSTAAAFDFTGTNYDGTTFQLSDHRGEVVLLFFGYTFCPDVCPFTLADLNMLYNQLGDNAENLTVVFVTVDPERDTLEKMASYVPAFNPNFYGVRLEGEMYEAVKTAYGVYVEKRFVEGSEIPGGYFVDHTGIIYLVDKVGNLSEVFPPNSDADFMQADVEYWLSQRG